MKTDKFISSHPLAAAFIFAAICFFPIMAMRDFSPSNELRYLNITDELIQNGHVFALTNQGAPYADKPPLFFWLMALGKLFTGSYSSIWLMMLSFIPMLVCIWLMDDWLKMKRPAERAASAMIMLTLGLFMGSGIFLRMDMLMTMFIVLALYSFWKLYKGIGNQKAQRILLPIWIFFALFTKGPVGFLVPPLTIVCFLLVKGQGRQIGKYLGWRTWGILAILFGLWVLGAWIDGGKAYINNLFFHQTVGRAVNAFHHKEPFWYYLPALAYSLAPWTLLLLGGLIASFCKCTKQPIFRRETENRRLYQADPQGERSDLEIFFLTEICLTVVMLSAFSSKLSIYLLPVLPFIAGLFPLVLERIGWRKWMGLAMSLTSGLVLAIALGAWTMRLFFRSWGPVDEFFTHYNFLADRVIWGGIAILGIGALIAFVWSLEGKRLDKTIFMLATSILMGIYIMGMDMPHINTFIGYGNLCREVPEGTEVATVRVSRPENMDYYLGRDVSDYGKDFDAFYKAEIEGRTVADGPLTVIIGTSHLSKMPSAADFIRTHSHQVVGEYVIINLKPAEGAGGSEGTSSSHASDASVGASNDNSK